MLQTLLRRGPRPLLSAVLLSLAPLAIAAEPASPPSVDMSGLPPLGEIWLADNPYRGDAGIAERGRAIYNAACSTCHGIDGDATRHVGNDLRMLDIYCYRRIKDPKVRAHCVRDNDDFFKISVLDGKMRVGVTHMPAWKGVLPQEAVWAIRTFLESRRP